MAANMTRVELAELVAEVKNWIAQVAIAAHRHSPAQIKVAVEALEAVIDQLAAHQAEPPQGWKLVPIEPTQEMKLAGTFAPNFRASESVWRAMLGKAPAIPTDSPGAVGGGVGEAL